jgi:hypothetical protein
LALDTHTFAWPQTWEILFAPSIVMRRMCRGVVALDRRLGGWLHRLVAVGERRWQQKNYMHKQALSAPEEDENFLVHAWLSLTPWSFGAMLDEARRFTFYDQAVPRAERRRAMAFYRRCVQRHLYACGCAPGNDRPIYLAKNPAFNSRVDTLLDEFPDARFIYVARNPLDAVPSFASATKWVWDFVGDPVEVESLGHYATELAGHGYCYPLERLERLPSDRYVVVRFDDLVGDAESTMTHIYRHLDIDLPPAYARILRQESERARSYRSRHRYAMQELGLSCEQIIAACAGAFERFGFDTRKP